MSDSLANPSLYCYTPTKILYFEFSRILLIVNIEQVTIDRIRIIEYSVDKESGDIGFYARRYNKDFVKYTLPRIKDDYIKINTRLSQHPLDYLIQHFRFKWD